MKTNAMKLTLLLALVAGSSACAKKYAVTPKHAETADLSLANEALVSISPKGVWTWRMAPEEVVRRLVTYAGNLDQNWKVCQDELAKRPASVGGGAPMPTMVYRRDGKWKKDSGVKERR